MEVKLKLLYFLFLFHFEFLFCFHLVCWGDLLIKQVYGNDYYTNPYKKAYAPKSLILRVDKLDHIDIN